MESVSAFVPILVNVKNKNSEFILKTFNNLNTTNPTDQDYERLKSKKTKLEFVLLSLVVFGKIDCFFYFLIFMFYLFLIHIGISYEYLNFFKARLNVFYSLTFLRFWMNIDIDQSKIKLIKSIKTLKSTLLDLIF